MNKVFVLGVATGAVSACVAAAALFALPLTANSANSETYRQLDLFGDVFERVRSDYVEPVEDGELIDSAIGGMLAALDPHSSYLNAKHYRDMQVQTKGEFGGLGIEVTMEDGFVKVVAPIDETPAAKAGVISGDLVTHLDDEPILGLSLNEAVDKMRGPVGTSILLTVRRTGVENAIKISITRDVIKIRSVRHRREGDVGYLRITTFNERTDVNVEKAVSALQTEIGDDLAGYVLDLRNNPGGLLDQAIAVSDAFLEKGEIVSTRGRHSQDTQRYNARRGDLTDGRPVIVLINGGSASASEIVAGALQDHRRAIVLGTRTFGKGSVQTIIPLGGGVQGAIRLTTARYYTPSGQSIQAKGIDPDIEVRQPTKDEEELKVRSEADLPGHLAAEGEERSALQAGPILEGDEDAQLVYALDLLRGIALASDKLPN
jgi:carboxyl-terminal processing protease